MRQKLAVITTEVKTGLFWQQYMQI